MLLEVVQCEADASLELLADTAEEDNTPQAAPAIEGSAPAAEAEGPEERAAATKEGAGEAEAAPRQLRLALPIGAAAAGQVEAGEALGVLHAMSYIDSLMVGGLTALGLSSATF